MSFDPNFPQENTIADAPKMRAQLLSLKTLAENAPAGPPGPPGPPGSAASITGAIVDHTDPANAVIRTDVVDGAPKLVLRNLFLYKTASPTQNLVDGNPGTTEMVVHDANPGFAYSVDVGSPADITTIKIAGDGADTSSPGNVTVNLRYSDDGATWTVIDSFVVEPANGALQAFTFPSAGAHQFWGFIVTGYDIPGHGSNASFSEMQGFDGATAVYVPAATAEVQAAAAADATAKADAAQAAAAAALSTLTPSQIGTLGFPAWDGGGNYAVGNVVSYAGVIYSCISAIVGAAGNPTQLPFSWTPIGSLFEAVATAAQGAAADSMNGAFLGAPMKLPFGWNFLGFEAWDGGTAYNPGDALTYASALYVATAPNTGVPPDSNPAVWTLVPTFFDPAGTAAAKADAVLAASSNNTNAVATLDTPYADPAAEELRQKMNEILLTARRS